MTTADFIHNGVFPAAFAFLSPRMDTPEARAMLLAIGYQESGFAHRKQVGGPARGFFQFEEGGGVLGVLGHVATKPIIDRILPVLVVRPWECYEALEQNDVLACIFARLLLWTHPHALPRRNEPAIAWAQYLDTWRPGKPHREVWDGNLQRAWEIVVDVPTPTKEGPTE